MRIQKETDLFSQAPNKIVTKDNDKHEIYAKNIISLAHAFARYLKHGKKINAKFARESITNIFGGTDADGVWNWKDVYEAQEVACILTIRHYTGSLMRKSFEDRLESLNTLQAFCLTHTKRSEDSVKFNQFSTPLPYALFAVESAKLTSSDVVLEPSAGTGIMASIAQMYGAEVVVNEYEPKRFAITKELFENAYNLNAIYINDTLDRNIRPSVVIMNPPFNMEDSKRTAQKHINGSYARLSAGGRLIAITGRTDDMDHYNTLTSVNKDVFYKHGTRIETFLYNIDKGGESLNITNKADTRFEFLDSLAILPNRLEVVKYESDGKFEKLLEDEKAKFNTIAKTQKIVVSDEINWTLSNELEYETQNWEPSDLEDIGIYQNYVPQCVSIANAKDHPADLVQSIAMNSAYPPIPTYKPILPLEIVKQGVLSEAQLETVIYAGQAHSTFLEGNYAYDEEARKIKPSEEGTEYRRGYFLGDGTGCGKGRQIAGVILDNWLQGRTRAVWFSLNDKLLEDAQRDWQALGGKKEQIISLGKFKYGSKISMDKGIMFVTYGTLSVGARENKKSRLDQLVEWLGTDYDGVIAFDEAHAMANATEIKTDRGMKKASARGILGLKLQYLLPKARILYVSATGASEVGNLAYADRLGLWRGGDTSFTTKEAFISKMTSGGIAAMEVVSRDMKSLGLYTARSLSYNGTEVNILEHNLTDDQTEIYDTYAQAYQTIHANLGIVLNMTSGDLNSDAKKNTMGKFESGKQRFFNHLLCGMKCVTLLKDMEHQLKEGNACVVQIVSTGESLLNKRLASIPISEYKDVHVDITPREYILEYLMTSFPIYTYEAYMDGDTLKSEILLDSNGDPVINEEALQIKDNLVNEIMLLPAIPSALDQIIHHFGHKNVAEVTGRSQRLILNEGKMQLNKRNAKSNTVETNDFMDDKKQILIFSKSGGTGRSYHADLNRTNQIGSTYVHVTSPYC